VGAKGSSWGGVGGCVSDIFVELAVRLSLSPRIREPRTRSDLWWFSCISVRLKYGCRMYTETR
jgi:hypothetical protein